MVADLRMSLERRGLEVHFQPIATPDGTVRSLEALVRWPHPVLGVLAPARFIGLAERSGLIRRLTSYALERALDTDGADLAIVRSTIALAHDLGLRVVAEGVETPEVAERLRLLGCDLLQGFLIGRRRPRRPRSRSRRWSLACRGSRRSAGSLVTPMGYTARAVTTTSPHHQHHDAMPTSGRALTGVAIAATLHCLTGCAIGEVLGVAIGTALGFSDAGTIALAIGLAFLFGYGLTSLPLLRAGFALAAVIPIALASDTLSIATMEVVDNAILLAVPGAMEAGLGDLMFWGSLSFALAIAGVVAVPVNRWLIARGRGHAVVHETGVHGGPSPRTVAIIAAIAFVFGSAVLLAELVDSDDGAMGAAATSHSATG